MRTLAIGAAVFLAASVCARSGENLSPEVFLPGHEATDAHAPAAAFGGGVYLIVWEAGRHEKADLVGLRIDKAGKILDAKPFVVSSAKDEQSRPRLAFGGGNFLVVWQDLRNEKDYDVYAARVSAGGKVLDPDGVAVASGEKNQCEPAVCFDGRSFQVLWRHFNGKGYNIHGGRVSTDVKLLDGKGLLLAESMKTFSKFHNMSCPGLIANGKGQILAGARGAKMQFWRMKDGKVDGKMVKAPIAAEPRFATDGGNALAVGTTFMQYGGRSTGSSKDGALLVKMNGGMSFDAKSKALSTTVFWQKRTHVRHPCPAWDGKTYVVAWDMEVQQKPKPSYDLVRLRRVSSSGEPQGQDVHVAGEESSPAFRPAAASDGAGTTLIAYEKHPKTGKQPIKIAYRMLR